MLSRFGIMWLLASLAGSDCTHAATTTADRVSGRNFPSVFQAWNPADTGGTESRIQAEARHDLLFHAADFFGLRWDVSPVGTASAFTPESLFAGRKRRENLLDENPNMVLLCELRYPDAHRSFLPADSRWWMRNETGEAMIGWEEGGYLLLDFANPQFQQHVARRARAAMDSGVFDGLFLDWWEEDDHRVSLVRAIRAAIGEAGLILVNANDRKSPRSAPFINGHFMECYRSETREDWSRIAESLRWAESNLREPRINCLETWFHESRKDLRRMRATTTLGLTQSNGYVLFSDPNPLPTPDHLHDWYSFWNVDIGKPLDSGIKRTDGSCLRRFEKGTAVYNPPGESTVVSFDSPHRRFSNGHVAQVHEIAALDGDIFIEVP